MFLSTPVHLAPRHVRARSAARRFIVISFGAACTGALAQSGVPAALRLQDVSVSATRFAERAADLPFGVSVLTAAEIQATGVTTVNDAIMKLLGVPGRLDLSGGNNYGLDLRGFGATADSNQVVVVDGIRISEADQSSPRLDGIPIDTVERIEVIRGSGAVLYGEGATGGVIVITTKAGAVVARKSQADLYAAAGSYGLREGRGAGTLVAGNFSLDVAANQRNADNHRDNFRSHNDGTSLVGQWRNEWLRVGVRHATDHLDSGLPGALTTAQYQADPRQASTPLDSGSIRNRRSSVFAQAALGDWQIGVDAGWRAKSLTSNYVSGGYSYDYDVDASTYALRARNEARFGAVRNSLVTGIDHDAWQRTVAGASGSVSNQHAQAYYLRDEVTLAGGTRLSAGGRSERITKDNSAATAAIDQHAQAWEIGIVQPVGSGVSVYARVGRSFRLANADEFGFTTPGLSLKTQTSRDTELGARWSHDGGRVELRLYRSALTDEIGYDPNAVGPSSAFGFNGANVNFDPTRRQGAEFEMAQAVGGSVNLRVNAATRSARFSAGPYAGRDVPLTPRHTYALRADWSPAPGHRIDGGVNYVSSQSPDFDNACRMPSYTTADLRYAYQWRMAELALGVNNLTDAKYYTQAFACVNGAVGSIYPEAGRAVTASLRLHF
ncbi:MAG: TonB-dependent receptor [Burkholderiales bacterium]|nr:TonB-dependent receptor [Burkholderiales bacterium]